jgi:hypothetical protein
MLTKENLLSVICFVSGLPEDAIRGQNRARGLVLCRHAYYFLAREKMGLKLAEIGEVFGSDHTTVIHGIKKVKDMLSINDEITLNFINKINYCIKEKYLIPTILMVSIPTELDANQVIDRIKEMGCSTDIMKKNFDA